MNIFKIRLYFIFFKEYLDFKMANSINLNTQTNLENNINNQNFRVLQIQFNDLLMKNRRLQSEVEDLKKKNNPFIKRSHGYFELKPAQQHNIRKN